MSSIIGQHKSLPFSMEHNKTVKMPNNQVVTVGEVKILIGMLNAERKDKKNEVGESAESIAKRLLKSKAKIEGLIEKLKELL